MTTRFIRLKGFFPASEDNTAQTMDYNVNIGEIIAFTEVLKDGSLPDDFKGSLVVTTDGMRTLVHETTRKIRSLIAEANAGSTSNEVE